MLILVIKKLIALTAAAAIYGTALHQDIQTISLRTA